jgi:putative transposase
MYLNFIIYLSLKHDVSLYLMNDKFRNKFRSQSHRRSGWDYSRKGLYFITLVTQHRECNLGKIVNKRGKIIIKFSAFGSIVKNEWLKSFEIREELFLDEYIIMPNHIHAIIYLNDDKSDLGNYRKKNYKSLFENAVDTHGRVYLRSNNDRLCQHQKYSEESKKHSLIRTPKSISSFIAGFKSSVNSEIDNYIDENRLGIPKYNRKNHFFQPNYYDRIIRDEQEYKRIKYYVINNPLNWESDSLLTNTN